MMNKLIFTVLFTSQILAYAQKDELHLKKTYHLVFIETEWCNYCKAMKKKVLNHPKSKLFFKDNSITVLYLNAELKDSIQFLSKSYNFNAQQGYNDLAWKLGSNNKQLTFPTTVLLNEEGIILYHKNEFVNVEELLNSLNSIIN